MAIEGSSEDPGAVLPTGIEILAGSDDLDTAVLRLLEVALSALTATTAAVYLQDPDRSHLELAFAVGVTDAEREVLEAVPSDADDPVMATASDRIARTLESGGGEAGGFGRIGVGTVAFRPLQVTRGGVDLPLGVVVIGWREPGSLDGARRTTLASLASLVSVAIDRSRLASMVLERSEWLQRMAQSDPLTGLANQRTYRHVLEMELARAGRQGSEVSVAIFDIDGLAAVNAAAGRGVGDNVLRSVAAVLAESVRLVDTVARHSGDEFALLAPGSAGALVARRVLDRVAALPRFGGRTVNVSVGVAHFPQNGATADELLAAATTALAAAQAAGPGHIVTAGTAGIG